MYGGSESVTLRSGATVRCGIDGDILVMMDGHPYLPSQIVRVAPSTAGLGGLELIVSPDERWAALLVYSGQSEQGWELFALEPDLVHISGLPYVSGEGPAPVFSPDSRYLAMILTGGYLERNTGEHAEAMLDPEAKGDVLIDWATLYVQQIPDGNIYAVPIGTTVPRSMEADELLGWDLYESLRFVAEDLIALPLPWGTVLEIALPLVGPITTPTPTEDLRRRD